MNLVLLLARVLKRSVSGARIPSMVPNMVLSPRLSSMRKKSADQKGLPGSRDMASVKAMNARPVPSAPLTQTSAPAQYTKPPNERTCTAAQKPDIYLLHLFLQVTVCEIARDIFADETEPGPVELWSHGTGIGIVEAGHQVHVHVAALG